MLYRKQDFKKIEPLGQGKKHTRIFKALHIPSDTIFALKEIEAKTIDKLNEYKEEAVQLMKVQPHNNIIKFFGYYFHQTNYGSFRIGIVTQFIDNSTCLQTVYRKRKKANLFWKETELATMLFSLLSSCSFLQQKNICHRDIKPANLFLLPSFELKLIDFGQSKDYVYDPEQSKETYTMATIRGTPQYLSPILWRAHVIDNSSRYAQHNIYKSDVFSSGLVLFQLANMSQVSGFNQRTQKVNGESLIREGISNLNKRYSKEFTSFIELMLVFEEKKRLSFYEIQQFLAEPDSEFWKNNNFVQIYNRSFSNIYRQRTDLQDTHHSEDRKEPLITVPRYDPPKEKKKYLESTLIQNQNCFWFQFGGTSIGKYAISKRDFIFPFHLVVCFIPDTKAYYLLGGPQNNNFKSYRAGKLISNPEAQIKGDRDFFPVLYTNRKLYVFGGYDSSAKKQLKTCMVFDVQIQRWSQIASMKTQRSMAAAVKINDQQILVIGGYNTQQGTLDYIEKYSIENDRFETVKVRLPLPLRRFVAVRLTKNVCIIFGGLTKNSKQSQRVFRLDFGKQQFMQLENLQKGGVIENQVLMDGQGNLHLFLQNSNGTSPHSHISYTFEQTQKKYETNNDY